MRQETAARKERERRQHRQEILTAALTLFARKGFHAVSMQEIAAAAEFATGSLYNFFQSKEDLYFELLVSCAEAAFGLILPALEGSRREPQKVADFIRLHEQLVCEHRAAIQLFLLERRGQYLPGPRIAAKKKEFDARLTRRLAEVIAAGVRKGLFNRLDPRVTAKCLAATLEAAVLAAVENPAQADLEADLRGIEEVFFKGLVKRPGGKRET
jgi:AcrR family transcriptional regulator